MKELVDIYALISILRWKHNIFINKQSLSIRRLPNKSL